MSKDTSLAGKDRSGADLRNADLTDKVLFQTDLRGANLTGARISLSCDTFNGLKLDDLQMALLLRMVGQADVRAEWQTGISQLVESIVGRSKNEAISKYLKFA